MKCPHCGSSDLMHIDMKDPEFEYYHCEFCGGNCHVPKESEPKVWD